MHRFNSLLFTSFFCVMHTLSLAAENDEQAQQDLVAVNSAMEEIQSWLEDANTRQSSEEENLRTAELELATVSQSVAALQMTIDATESELSTLQDRQSQLAAEKNQQSDVLGQAIRSIYMAGDQSFLKMMLNQENIAESSRMLYYSRVFSETQMQKIGAYQSILNEIEQVNNGLENNLNNLSQQRNELVQQVAVLDKAKSDRERILSELTASIAARSSELEQLEINQAELQALIEEIRRAMQGVRSFADVARFVEQRGRLQLPANGPIISRFGSSYGEGNLSRQGITIGVTEGTPVQAIHAGRIVFSDWLRGSGLLVIVDHGDGYMSLYGSNQALAKQAGEWVDAGDILAISGNGGDGLYFEIRHHGEAQNPALWLQSAD